MDIYQHDESLRKKGASVIAGIDEAGRGPLAGPVVAASVILHANTRIEGLRDSKKVPEKERKRLFWEILCQSRNIGIGIIEHDEIDRLNILNASKRAMEQSFCDLSMKPDFLVIDAVSLPSIPVRQISPVKADSKSAAVAAASIVAKYVRDTIMEKYDFIYPLYNFRKHKGYCTEEHMKMIRLHGPCPIHRKTFNKVQFPELPF